jgi:MYXO-CTERM domain-containing protein
MRRNRVAGLACLFTAFASLAVARPAEACGGTFCDSGPRFMSVDQTGENIIFVMEPGIVEAHIQIQYRGEAAKFSWILPVQKLPEVEVGSEALFNRLLQATVPRYGYTTQRDVCGPFGGTSGAGGGGGSGGGGFFDASAAADSSVSVVLSRTVGAFDIKVIQATKTQDILDWLTQNQYTIPPNAPTLFDGYVAKSYLFVAVKLTGGAGTDQIHPLVVRYQGTEPCVPLKLTAVAAVEDMGVRTFFLGTKRVVPKGQKHVVPNPVKLDWMTLGANYTSLVSSAVDSPIANGHAFVTEYAGPTAVVGTGAIASPSWNAAPFAAIAPVDVVTQLSTQGFMSCSSGSVWRDGGFTTGAFCNYNHPLILPLLREYLPAPAMLTELPDGGGKVLTDPAAIEPAFYRCLSCYAGQIDMSKWDAGAFTSALSSRIIAPARHADQLLVAWPYLTRMFTTISPVEMTEDPEFWEHDGLGTVNATGSAVRRVTCTGASGMTLPDGRQVALTPQSTWPGFTADMPWAERIEEFTSTSGPPILLVDNAPRINSLLKMWNDSQKWPPPPDAGPGAGTGGSGNDAGATTDAGMSPGGAGGAGGARGTGGAATAGAGGAPIDAEPSGAGCECGIASTPSRSNLPVALGAALALLAARRRRRPAG